MKRVSFKVAKAIKDAGYSQHPNISEFWYVTEHSEPIFDVPYKKAGTLVDDWDFATNMVAAPTYIEVWLWLWREKHIALDLIFDDVCNCTWDVVPDDLVCIEKDDPEEAIVEAINYLVINKLLK